MYQKIDLEAFITKLSAKTDIDANLLKEMLFDLFVHIRANTECGLWVEIEGFGSFHPLWYELKKYKDATEDERILETLHIQNQLLLEQEQSLVKRQKVKEEEKPQLKESALQKAQSDEQIKLEMQRKEQEALRRKQIRLEAAKKQLQKKKRIQEIKKDLTDKPKREHQVWKLNSLRGKSAWGALMVVALILYFMMNNREDMKDSSALGHKNQQIEDSKSLYKVFECENKPKDLTREQFYHYTVTKGDNLYELSQRLYGHSKFWPLIYVENQKHIKDVDKIFVGEELKIVRIKEDESLNGTLAKLYIKAYKSYKNANKDNKAHWLLYWSQKHIDSKLFETFSDEIEHEDMKQVQGYMRQFSRD